MLVKDTELYQNGLKLVDGMKSRSIIKIKKTRNNNFLVNLINKII